jgi:glycosyltransferase involved in cell wall biosynthesis
MRVAIVTETYPPEINGVAMTIGRTVDALKARDYSVQLVRPRQISDPKTPTGNGIEQILVGGVPIPGYAGLRMGLPATGKLRAIWARQRPNIVHIATEGPLGWSAMRAAAGLGIPVVAGFHTNFHSYTRHYGIGWLHQPIHAYLRHFHNRARLTLVPTQTLQNELSAARYQNVEVMARGVDTTLFSPDKRRQDLREKWGVGEGGLAVIYVGRIAPEKNLPLLVRAFAAIERVRPDARLVLVGDGPDADRLCQQHPRFVFSGSRRGEDLAAHYASGDLFLFPSQTETFGNVVLEAMASGLATLGFDYAATAEHVRAGVNGFKVALGDDEGFIAQAVALSRGSLEVASVRAQARETTLNLSWDRIFLRLEGYYQAIIA